MRHTRTWVKMGSRQYQQNEHTKVLIKGKNNKQVYRQIAHCRLKAPTLSQISARSIKVTQTY